MNKKYTVWFRFPNGNWLIERSFMEKKYAHDFIRFRKNKDAEIGDKREYIITINKESPSDKYRKKGEWTPDSIYEKGD